MADFSLTTLFVVPVGQTAVPSSGSTQDLSAGTVIISLGTNDHKGVKTEKELATDRGDPFVSIVKIDIDPDNINAGSFELDWNSKFAANLARAGYQKKPGESEDVIVDRWFKEICRNIVLELYEQDMADPDAREADALKEELRYIKTRDLGDGRTEVS
jgi:hypothetical protein